MTDKIKDFDNLDEQNLSLKEMFFFGAMLFASFSFGVMVGIAYKI